MRDERAFFLGLLVQLTQPLAVAGDGGTSANLSLSEGGAQQALGLPWQVLSA